MTEHNPDYFPNMAEVHRFMVSNPSVSFEMLAKILGIGDEEKADVSGGRFRELWKQGGGMYDKKGNAWVEVSALPLVLRRIIDTVKALDSAPAPSASDEELREVLAHSRL